MPTRFTRMEHYFSLKIWLPLLHMSFQPWTASMLCSAAQDPWPQTPLSRQHSNSHANALTNTTLKLTCRMFIALQWVCGLSTSIGFLTPYSSPSSNETKILYATWMGQGVG